MAAMTVEERNAFLRTPRIAALSYVTDGDRPLTIPIWFDWDGTVVRMFGDDCTSKVAALRERPSVSMMVAAGPDEPLTFVAIDGEVEVSYEGASDLGRRIMTRYLDTDLKRTEVSIEAWTGDADHVVAFTLLPKRFRTRSPMVV